MTEQDWKQTGKKFSAIASQLLRAMSADDFRYDLLAFLFLRFVSDNDEQVATKELGRDHPAPNAAHDGGQTTPSSLLKRPPNALSTPEKRKKKRMHCSTRNGQLWPQIADMAHAKDRELHDTLRNSFKHFEDEALRHYFTTIISKANHDSGEIKNIHEDLNTKFNLIIDRIDEELAGVSLNGDTLGDAYENLIGWLAARSRNKDGEFYTPQRVSDILSAIVTLDNFDPKAGMRKRLTSVMDFACGSGSLLLNVRKRMDARGIEKIYGQDMSIMNCNLARMNMLMHGVKYAEFDIFCGDTLMNDWKFLHEKDPAKKPRFGAVIANPPFSYRWAPDKILAKDQRFKNYGLAPKHSADFAFLLHGLHYLEDDGVMAIILPHGVLLRGGVEAAIRRKLLENRNIDTVIGLPANLFYSTGIPVCILVLKKRKQHDDVLFINASEFFVKGKPQSYLSEEHAKKIIDAYQERPESIKRYARRVNMDEIEANDFNLSISRYVSIEEEEVEIDLSATHEELIEIENRIRESTAKHNAFLKELGVSQLPTADWSER